MAMRSSTASLYSRRRFLALSGAASALAASGVSARAQSYAAPVPGPPGQTPRYAKTDLWVQLTTGGKPYPPTLQEMFLDPMFIGMDVWPIDQPASFDALAPDAARTIASAPAPVRPASGRSAVGGGTERLEPADYPWEPSGGRPHPGYDVLVLNDQADWSESQRKAIQRSVDAGRGFVLLHYSLGDNQDWPWWYQQVTGGLFVLSERESMKKSTSTKVANLNLTPAGKHPILRNVGPLSLRNEDVFKGMWQSPQITPLLQTSNPASDKTVAWIGPNAKARTVCIQVGSSRETHRDPHFRMLIRNSILWAGNRLI